MTVGPVERVLVAQHLDGGFFPAATAVGGSRGSGSSSRRCMGESTCDGSGVVLKRSLEILSLRFGLLTASLLFREMDAARSSLQEQ